jgi:hypothetical protein
MLTEIWVYFFLIPYSALRIPKSEFKTVNFFMDDTQFHQLTNEDVTLSPISWFSIEKHSLATYHHVGNRCLLQLK